MPPECPDCGSDRVRGTSLLRIDPDTLEPLDRVQAFECSVCDTVFKKVEDDG
ncbi:Zn finger [Haloarcula virus HCTV-16]|nr:Zn finger [Haloarcula virus HCTV-16]